jgi:LacI family transcriptional regulator
VQKKVSLKDVAQKVGVSIALVSYVLNNKEKKARIGEEMALRIRKAAEELNYKPNLIAKSLKSGKTNTIGLIVADISNPFFSSIARIIEDEAKKLGYIVIFGSSDESAGKSADLIDVFLNRQVDAFIIAPAAGTEEQIIRLKEMKVPFVLIDRYFPDIPTDSVHINNFQAAFLAVDHLISVGRKRIAMVAYDLKLAHMLERQRGYSEGLKRHRIPFKKNWLVQASYQRIGADVASGLHDLLVPSPQIDAIFFATNSLAVEGLKKINELGIKVPDQVAVISFDETDAFDFFYSPITYVSQTIADLGKWAVKLAINRIEDAAKSYDHVVVEPRLVIRESSGRKASGAP